jgi:hypothetical protein
MATRDTDSGGFENRFKAALRQPTEEYAEDAAARITPFARGRRPSNPTKEDQLRTVGEMGLVDRAALERTPTVRDLTVRDLNDLASEFSGIPTNNPKVAELTVEDVQDLEGVFLEFKLRTVADLARPDALQLESIDVSCCCCTPCCCCAATDLSHTA